MRTVSVRQYPFFAAPIFDERLWHSILTYEYIVPFFCPFVEFFVIKAFVSLAVRTTIRYIAIHNGVRRNIYITVVNGTTLKSLKVLGALKALKALKSPKSKAM